MHRALRTTVIIAAMLAPVAAACSSSQQPALNPNAQAYSTYQAAEYPEQTFPPQTYPTSQQYPPAIAVPNGATQPADPIKFVDPPPLPSAMP